jgi:hypothetical protein
MPGKLLYFITLILLIALFMGFNLGNTCNISVIFYVFKDVPIFVSMIFAFALGNIAVLPFLIGRRRKIKNAEKQAAVYHDVAEVELKSEKRGWFGKKKKDNSESPKQDA